MEEKNKDDTLEIIINGEKYLLPIEFIKESSVLSKHAQNTETLFLYEDKNLLNFIIKYWHQHKENFLFKIYDDLLATSILLPEKEIERLHKLIASLSLDTQKVSIEFKRLEESLESVINKIIDEAKVMIDEKNEELLTDSGLFLKRFVSKQEIRDKLSYQFSDNTIINLFNKKSNELVIRMLRNPHHNDYIKGIIGIYGKYYLSICTLAKSLDENRIIACVLIKIYRGHGYCGYVNSEDCCKCIIL